MATLQVRDIDDRLYEALRARARSEHRSVSQEVVFIIEDHLSKSTHSSQKQTELFLGLTGAWEGSESAEQLVASIRKSRKNSNRFGGRRVSFD
jgi:plasmid stability protein